MAQNRTAPNVALLQKCQNMGMSYTVAFDASETVSLAYGVSALPTMFLVDKKGVIREAWVGFVRRGTARSRRR